jgi:hypothetical protein
MANEPLALAITPPDAPSEDDYRSVRAALSESGRGRAFLAEHARRNRHADTEALLAAIGRVEAHLQADASAAQRLRDDLRMLLIAVRLARPEIDAQGPVAQAAKLKRLLDLFERRIEALAGATSADAVPPPATAPAASFTVVPLHDEPELPIPAPARSEPRPLALVGTAPAAPAVVETIAAEPTPAVAETAVAAPPAPAVAETTIVEIAAAEITVAEPAAQPALPPPDPLAALMALSEDERLALFT